MSSQSQREIAVVMFAEAEPLMRERRAIRRRLAELRDARDDWERTDTPDATSWYSTDDGVEYGRLDNRADVLSDELSDVLLAAFGHAMLAIAEVQR